MSNYLVSVHASADAPARPPVSEQEMRQSYEKMMKFEEEMRSAGVFVFSGRLTEPDTATVVRMASGEVATTDGPFVESKEHLAGFYIIEATDLDDALAWASRATALVGAPLEVRPFGDNSTA